jgi:hypothetical protein
VLTAIPLEKQQGAECDKPRKGRQNENRDIGTDETVGERLTGVQSDGIFPGQLRRFKNLYDTSNLRYGGEAALPGNMAPFPKLNFREKLCAHNLCSTGLKHEALSGLPFGVEFRYFGADIL